MVWAVKQDREGYMWLATQNGLVRYDGYQYKVYYLGADKLNPSATTNASSLYIDKQNNLWVACFKNGLFKYNRLTDSFEQFLYPTPDCHIFYINTTDNEGNIWGTTMMNNGSRMLSKFNPANKKFELFGNKQKGNNYINATFYFTIQNLDGAIWVPTTNGLYKYNGSNKPFTGYFTSADTAKQAGFNPLYEAPSQPGIFWLNSFHGNDLNLKLISWDHKKNTLTEYKPGHGPHDINTASINSFYEDKRKQLWIATDSGLSKLDRKTGYITNYVPQDTIREPTKMHLTTFSETGNGNFWLHSPVGLIYFNTATSNFQRYRANPTDPGAPNSDDVYNQYVDHTGTFWAGYDHEGASKINKIRSAFTIYKNDPVKKNSYPADGALIMPFKGFTLAENNKAIYKWNTIDNYFEQLYTSSKGEFIISPILAAKDGLWYFGNYKGLRVYDPLKKTSVQYTFNPADSTSVCSNIIIALYQDHNGVIWVGSADKGICSFDRVSKKFKHYPYRNDQVFSTAKNRDMLDNALVETIYEDRENNLWVGTNNGSLNRFDRKTGKFISYFTYQNRAMLCTVQLLEDKKGRFWASNYLQGLFEFDRQKKIYTRHFNEQNGLLFNTVYAITEDAHGNIWLQTERGLTRINANTLAIKNFKLDEILPGYDFVSNEQALAKLNDGRFALTLKTGLAVFDPKDLDDDPNPPIVHIETILHSNPRSDRETVTRVIAYGNNKIALPYNQNRIQFNYVALHYDNPQENKYAYRLDGYDKQWVQAGTTRNVTYNNLSPGTYTFHVIAANSSGVWNKTGDSMVIVIATPWWLRWWAWLIYIALFAWAVRAYIAYRSRQLKRENMLLEEKVRLRTRQLSEQQEEIIAQRDQLSDANKDLSEKQEEITVQRDQLAESIDQLKSAQRQLVQSEKLASLGELTAGIAHEIQNPLNFVNNFSEVSMELVDEITEELKNGDTADAILIAADIKGNLEKIIHHGRRADGIVKNMLQHSHSGTGEKELTDINTLADEYLRLSYHGLRAKDKGFNSEMITHYDPNLPKIEVLPQDIGRVLLNLYNNAFYAINQRKKIEGTEYTPEVTVTTTAPPTP